MTAYRHEEFDTGTDHKAWFYAAVVGIASTIGTVLAVLTFA